MASSRDSNKLLRSKIARPRADYFVVECFYRRNRERNFDQRTVFAAANGFKMVNSPAAADFFQNQFFFIIPLFGNQYQDRLPDGFFGAEAVTCASRPRSSS